MSRPRHAFVVRDTATIPPLGTTAADTWFLRGPLFEQMSKLLGTFGIAVERVDTMADALARAAACPDGALVTHDSVAYSRSVVAQLLVAFERDAARRPVIAAALPEARATKTLAHISGLEPTTVDEKPAFTVPLWAVRGASSAPATSAAVPVLLPYKELEWKMPTPAGMLGNREESFSPTDTYLVRVDHWAHILRLNLAALVASWFELWNTPGGKLWFLWRAICGFPWSRGRLAASFNKIHRKAKVHHTAHVELSVIEEGAEIGAHAIVKNSYVGKGARIDDGALVNACVLADGAFVASVSAIFSTVLYPGAFAAQQKMQFSVLGENSVAFTGSYCYDVNFDRNVHVPHRGKIVDSGSRFLSVCLGPWSRVAGGIWLGSGREIPANALIVQPPENVVQKIDVALASSRMTTVKDRALIDVGPLPRQMPEAKEPPKLTDGLGAKETGKPA